MKIPDEIDDIEFHAEIGRIIRGEPGWSLHTPLPPSARFQRAVRNAKIGVLRRAGMSLKRIAENFDMTPSNAGRICKRFSRKAE